jgi:hypothetical protein
MASRGVTSSLAVRLPVIMIAVIVAYGRDETRERLNCVASLDIEWELGLERKPLARCSSKDLAIGE